MLEPEESVLVSTMSLLSVEDESISATSRSSIIRDKNEGKGTSAMWCLIDHPEIWTKIEKEKCAAMFRNSSRLMSLMKKPKNEIVQFPDSAALTEQFSCVMCNEIPFPWAGFPFLEDSSSSENNPEGIFLCSNGHTVCRTCGQCCFTCTASTADCSISCTSGNGGPTQTETLEPTSGSITIWGQIQLCFHPITSFNCFFLQDMITETEFACKYFYNWCHFRGKGKNLKAHESECPFRFSLCKADSINASDPADLNHDKQGDSKLQDDREEMTVAFKQNAAIAETTRLLKMYIPNWDELNPRNRAGVSKKKKR